jgi:hypothetical protein
MRNSIPVPGTKDTRVLVVSGADPIGHCCGIFSSLYGGTIFQSPEKHNATSAMNEYFNYTELTVCQQWKIILYSYIIM